MLSVYTRHYSPSIRHLDGLLATDEEKTGLLLLLKIHRTGTARVSRWSALACVPQL